MPRRRIGTVSRGDPFHRSSLLHFAPPSVPYLVPLSPSAFCGSNIESSGDTHDSHDSRQREESAERAAETKSRGGGGEFQHFLRNENRTKEKGTHRRVSFWTNVGTIAFD